MAMKIRYTHDNGVALDVTDSQGFVASVQLSWREVEELEARRKRIEQEKINKF